MNLLFCINDGYLYPLINLLYSIKENSQNLPKTTVYVLSTRFGKESQKILQQHCDKLNFELCLKRVGLRDLKVNYHYSLDMYLRIFAFSLLPKTVDKVLYLDADMLCLGNILNLYDLDIEGKIMACVSPTPCEQTKNCSRLAINHRYFNSGMLLMNLKNIRAYWTEQKIWDMVDKLAPVLRFPDQDILNALCSEDELLFLDDIFNFRVFHSEKRKFPNNILILHYVGKQKPWNTVLLKKHEKLFWKYFEKTGITEFKKRTFAGGGFGPFKK